MIPARRREYLIELLERQTVLGINELTEHLGVSHMTVRRDISHLEEQGLVLAVSGGVRLVERDRHEPSWAQRATTHTAEKSAIARRAAADVHDGMSIYLDAGTTTFEMARLLTRRRDLSIVTNNFHISALLAEHPHIELFHTGGRINHENYSAVGPSVVQFLRHVNLDIAFISSSSWHIERGLTTPDEAKILVKQQLLHTASKHVLVTDSSKYGRFGMFRACGLEDFDLIITDNGLAESDRDAIRDRDIALETVANNTLHHTARG